VSMKEHYPTQGEAIRCVESDLRSWEILAALQFGPGSLFFDFEAADIIERTPSPPGAEQGYSATASGGIVFGGSADCVVHRGQYPSPPHGFRADPIVVSLWGRYARYRDGGEPLTGMAYFCLTVMQADAGGRKEAAAKFRIHADVLKMLGKLSSEAGNETEARKLDKGSTFVPLTEKQRAWMDAAVRKLVRRAGEYAADPNSNHAEITMADLPDL
jgi:hypothetical protein